MRNYTDEEIWASLEKKMKPILKEPIYFMNNGRFAYFTHYEEVVKAADVKAAIVSAYRSGYGRAMKGRSFLLGEKIEREVFEKDGVKYVAVDDEIKDGDLCVFLAKETTHPKYYPAYGTILIATLNKGCFSGEMWFNNHCYNKYIDQIKKVIPLEC